MFRSLLNNNVKEKHLATRIHASDDKCQPIDKPLPLVTASAESRRCRRFTFWPIQSVLTHSSTLVRGSTLQHGAIDTFMHTIINVSRSISFLPRVTANADNNQLLNKWIFSLFNLWLPPLPLKYKHCGYGRIYQHMLFANEKLIEFTFLLIWIWHTNIP